MWDRQVPDGAQGVIGLTVQSLLEELAERLFLSEDSPISSALELLKDGAVLRVSAPGGCAAGKKKAGEIYLVDPEDAVPLFEIHFLDPGDLEAFKAVSSAEEFGELFLSMAREERLRLDMLLPFMELWTMGVGLFLQEIGILSAPLAYSELIQPLQLREIAFTDILDVRYLQGLVNDLAEITGVRLWVLDMNSMPVVVSVAGGEHCKLIIDSLEGVMRCYDSAIGGLAELKKNLKPRVRICHAGFICFDAPLILGGEMVGMISGDASLMEPADPEKYRRLAEELDVDPEPLLASLDQVRNVNIEEVEFLLSVVNAIAQVVTEMSFKQYLLSAQINENKDLARELWFKNTELKALFQSFVEIQERERAAVARDLHDDTGQNLTNALVNLELALGEEGTPKDMRKHIESASSSISKVVKQLHDLSASLHPPVLDDLGLIEAMRTLVRRMNADHSIEFTLVTNGVEGELSGETKINLYRIVQEALNNIVKHSGASEAVVRFSRSGEGINLLISDNGQGFEEFPDDGKVHLGMVNMRERAEQIGGTFELPHCERGVIISVRLPL
jgi:signal transduction histidine kinase